MNTGCVVYIAYQIDVVTTDRQDAGTQHNAWLILEGDERTSHEFLMENSARHKILCRSALQHVLELGLPTVPYFPRRPISWPHCPASGLGLPGTPNVPFFGRGQIVLK